MSSENEFRERSGTKKTRDLPLGLILSFNDKDVHPKCPNISNPYHKCGRHCLDEIPFGKSFLDAIRLDGDREWEKKSEKRGVNPNCPCTSNPHHKCAEYCLEEVSEKRQDARKNQPGKYLYLRPHLMALHLLWELLAKSSPSSRLAPSSENSGMLQRWRDVKLRAFDNVKHHTYVDLKDKWKTMVHTARISPQ